MKRGKQTCRILKEIRRQIAEANDIEFITSECQYKEDCLGTCPKCEAEVRYLEQELEHRRMTGKLVTLAGISAGMLTMNTYAQSGGSGNTITSSSKIELQDSLKPSKEAIIIGYIPVQQYDETDRCTVPVKQTKISKIEIAGSVKDECGNVLLGASIREKGTNNGTRSQTDGTFSLQVSGKHPVIVSCIGYSPIKIPVKLLSDSLQIILEELWEGEVMPMTEYNGNSKRKNIIKQDSLSHRTEAEFPGGMQALLEYLKINIEYPLLPEEHGINGGVVVKFIIDKDGKIKYPRISRSVDPVLDRMALERIWQMPQWKPATENGSSIPYEYVVSVRFITHYIPYEEFKVKEEYNLKAQQSTPVYGRTKNNQPDTFPRYPGGLEKLIADFRIYVEKMREQTNDSKWNDMPSRTTVGFIIEKDGSVSNIKVSKMLNSVLNKKVIHFIKQMPRWTPGTKDGKIVRSFYTVPLFF